MGLMDEDSLIDKLRDGLMGALHDPDLSRGLQQRDLALRVAHDPGRTVVQFRKLPQTHQKGKKNVQDKDVFILELGYRDLYSDIVGRVANILHVHPMRIRLGRHYCYSNRPIPLDPQFIRLSDLLKMSNTICNVLYYEVLPDPYKHDLSKLYEFSGIVDDIKAHYRHEDQLDRSIDRLFIMKGGKMKVESSKAGGSKLAVKNTKPMKMEKKAKDPNTKPKNPVNAYFVFMEKFREQYMKEHPDKSVKDAHYAAGIAWNALSQQEKASYVTEFKERKIAYDKAMKAYNKKPHGGGEDSDVSDPDAWE